MLIVLTFTPPINAPARIVASPILSFSVSPTIVVTDGKNEAISAKAPVILVVIFTACPPMVLIVSNNKPSVFTALILSLCSATAFNASFSVKKESSNSIFFKICRAVATNVLSRVNSAYSISVDDSEAGAPIESIGAGAPIALIVDDLAKVAKGIFQLFLVSISSSLYIISSRIDCCTLCTVMVFCDVRNLPMTAGICFVSIANKRRSYTLKSYDILSTQVSIASVLNFGNIL